MSTVEEGCTVIFHYSGTLPDGEVFDSSGEREPMMIRIGAGQVIPGFEAGVMGMKAGETRTFTLLPEDAYGEYVENRRQRVEKERFPDPKDLKAGMRFQVNTDEGHTITATVVEVGAEDVLLDLNHPLAGKVLTFEVECLEVRDD